MMIRIWTVLAAALLLAGCGGRTETEHVLGEGPDGGGTTSSGTGGSSTDDGGGSGGPDASESERGATTCPPANDTEYTLCDGIWRGPVLTEPECAQAYAEGSSCTAAQVKYACMLCSDAGVPTVFLCGGLVPPYVWHTTPQQVPCVP